MNLTLAVLDRRPDGFHEIESWVVPIDLFDELTIEPAPALEITVQPPSVDVPTDSANLVWHAAESLAVAAKRTATARIHLHKSIPAGAGLGGGSSDAAAAIVALNALWGLNWPIERLCEVGAAVGSDVPLFLHGTPAVIRGRGERVEPLAAGWRGWMALVIPRFGVSTAAVYARWTRPSTRSHSPRDCWTARGDSRHVGAMLFNDLEPAAFALEPRLAALHGTLGDLDGRPVRMTGSGSCLFAIFDSRTEADNWRDRAAGRIETQAEIKVVRTLWHRVGIT